MNNRENKSGLGREIPPLKARVVIYFIQKGMTERDADFFLAAKSGGLENTKQAFRELGKRLFATGFGNFSAAVIKSREADHKAIKLNSNNNYILFNFPISTQLSKENIIKTSK